VQAFSYQQSPYSVREDLGQAYREFWSQLAKPGSWWTGAQRVAIARETRNAVNCDFCEKRRRALSPYTFPGEHEHDNGLDPLAVDAVHRIITDQSRITLSYIQDNEAKGFSREQYVELAGIAVVTFSIDEFNRALGLPLEALPEPEHGEPTH